ncbi:hypothetical protein PENSPDRAFT_190544 [Peniophora sp. CONT]|nr:hypothetical protein PENSPDRAFT_190544 [Peniophora sp. CONT]
MSSNDPLVPEQARLAWSGFMASRFQPQRHPVRVHELDYELELLQEFSVLAKLQRNAHIWMCRLPAELLVYIFDLLRNIWKPSGFLWNDGVVTYELGWINATHVCSAWRKVALSAPSLWCNIDCSSVASRMRKPVLERSVQLPLSLTFNFGTRARRHHDTWAKDWLSTTYILRRLHDMPQLLSLTVERDNSTSSDDVHHAVYNSIPAVENLIDLLSVLAHLEELRLVAIPVPRSHDSDSDPDTNAPTVKRCTLPPCFRIFDYTIDDWNGSIQAAFTFIPQLRFPHVSEIKMSIEQDEDEARDGTSFARLADLIYGAVDRTHDCPWELSIDDTSMCAVFNDGDTGSSDVSILRDLPGQALSNQSTRIITLPVASKAVDIVQVFGQLPVTRLTYLSITLKYAELFFPTSGIQLDALFNAQEIRHVAIPLSPHTSFFREIIKTRTDNSTIVALLFPRLQVLTLRWHPAMTNGGADPATFKDTLSEIIGAVIARRQCTTPVSQLQLDRRYEALHDWGDIEGLRVAFFEHDGLEA